MTTTTSTRGTVTAADMSARPASNGWTGFGRLTAYSFWKLLTNPFQLSFAIALPIFMYMLFGAFQEFSSVWIGHANVAASVLVNMALYGAIMTTSSMGANVSLERTSGVSRLFALTPMVPMAQIFARVVAEILITALVVIADWIVGYATGARMESMVWVTTGVLIVVLSVLPSVLGLAAGFAVRSDGAFAVNSVFTVVGAFASGMFIPLEQMGSFFQSMAPWGPFYGMVQIAQSAIYGWDNFSWWWVVNTLAWTLILAVIAAWGQGRDTGR